MVQRKGWVRGTVFAATPVVEQELAEAGAFNPLQELLGDDLIGVDVGPIERDDLSFMSTEWLHEFSRLLGSVGRTLLSADFDFGLHKNFNSGGQECPPHTI